MSSTSFVDAIKDFAPQTAFRSLLRKLFFPRTHVELQFAVDAATAERNGLEYDDQYHKSDWFEAVSLLAIFINAIVLANADPLNPDSAINQLIDYVDAIMTFFFLAELLLRIACFGLIIFEAEIWFVVDLVVVFAGLLSWILSFISTGSSMSLSALRAIRLLRPLRSIRVISSVRLFLAALIEAVHELTDVLILLLIFIIVLSVAGVSQYNSRLRFHCIGSDFNNIEVHNRTGITDINEYMPYGEYEVARQETFLPVYDIVLKQRVPFEDFRYLVTNGTFAGTPLMLSLLATPGCFDYLPFVPCSKLVAWPPEGDPSGISWNYTAKVFVNYTQMLLNGDNQSVPLNLTAINETEPGVNESLPLLQMMRMCYADEPSATETRSTSPEITETERTQSLSITHENETTTTTTTVTSATTKYNVSTSTTTTQTTTLPNTTTTAPPVTMTPGGPPVSFQAFDHKPYELFRKFLTCWGSGMDPYDYEARLIYTERGLVKDWWFGIWELQTCNNVTSIVFKGYTCPWGYECKLSGNPFHGYVGFDSLPQAAFSVFICVTLELFADLSSMMADAVDATAIFYFLLIVLFGAFFIINLAIAQMTVAFSNASEAEEASIEDENNTMDKRDVSKVEALLQKFYNWAEEARKAEYVPVRENDNIAEGDIQAMCELTKLIAQRKRLEREREKLKSRIAAEIAAGGNRARELLSTETVDDMGPEKVQLSRWQKRRRNTRNFLYNPAIQMAVVILIVLNLIQLASEYYGMPALMVEIYRWVGVAFTAMFTVEFVLRLFALGPVTVLTRSFTDWIDFMVITMSWLSVFVASLDFPVVRTFRILRVFVLMQGYPNIKKWVMVIAYSARQMTVLIAVTFSGIFILSCIAVQLFGGKFCNLSDDDRPDNSVPSCPDRPRANFDKLSSAMLSNFQIMTADNWDGVLFIGMQAFGNGAALYFIGWFFVGNMVLANIVIAILVVAMADAVEESNRQQEELARIRKEYEDPESGGVFTETDRQKREKEAKVNAQRRQLEERKSRSELQQQVVEFTDTLGYNRGYVILLVVSCLCTALEQPREAPDETAATLFANVEFVTQIFFFLDVACKVFAYGFLKTQFAYLRRSLWFVFDFVVFSCTFLGGVVAFFHLGANSLQVLRVGRALRPLRLVSYSTGMLGVALTLRDALVPMRSLLIIVLAGFAIWGVIGVQLYAGSFYSCSDSQYTTEISCLNNTGAKWLNAERHFDHLGAAVKTLFTVVSLDHWVDIMWDCIDAVGPGVTFQVNHNKMSAIYPMSFVVVGAFFLLNLFVSVLIDTYQQQKSTEGRTVFITEGQAGWIKTQSTIVGLVPLVDYDDDEHEQAEGTQFFQILRRKVRAIVRHPLADVLVYCFIAVNFLVMAADRFPKSETSATVISITNALFTLIFTLECVLKIIAEGTTNYFKSKWNSFDFFVVLFSLLGILVEYAMSSTTIASAFRTLRVLRLFRLLRKSRRLQVVIKKFAFALLSLKNISSLIALFFLVFAIIGVKIFGRIAEGPDFRRRATFSNLQNAMIMLLRAVTAAEWPLHMVHTSITPETGKCDTHLGDCGAFGFAEVYYMTFVTIGAFIFLNLFIAVVLDSYSSARHVDSDAFTEWEGGQLLQLWLRFDPEMRFRMHSRFLVTFLRSIPTNCCLSLGEMPSRRRLQHEVVSIDALGIKELSGLVELQDIVVALCRVSFHSELPEERRRGLQKKANMRFRTDDRNRDKPDEKSLLPAVKRFAVMILEAYYLRRYEILERRDHYVEVRKRRERSNRVLAQTFGLQQQAQDGEDQDDSNDSSPNKDGDDEKGDRSTSEKTDGTSSRGASVSKKSDGGGGGDDFQLPPEAEAARDKLQAAVVAAKAEAAKVKKYDAQGWMKTEDSGNKQEPGKPVTSSQFRTAAVPMKQQTVEESIAERGAASSHDLWQDVGDLIRGGGGLGGAGGTSKQKGDDTLVLLGQQILKKQQAQKEVEAQAKLKKLEAERKHLNDKVSDLSYDEIANLLMPSYKNKTSGFASPKSVSDEKASAAAAAASSPMSPTNTNDNNNNNANGENTNDQDNNNNNNNNNTNTDAVETTTQSPVAPPSKSEVAQLLGVSPKAKKSDRYKGDDYDFL